MRCSPSPKHARANAFPADVAAPTVGPLGWSCVLPVVELLCHPVQAMDLLLGLQTPGQCGADCWDCEIQTTYGWIECAGLADRSAYDLTQHSKATGVDLVAYEQYDNPHMEEAVDVVPQMKVIGKVVRGAAKEVVAYLQGLSPDAALELKVQHCL